MKSNRNNYQHEGNDFGKKTSRFNLFNRYAKDGRGVDKDEERITDNPNLINYFKLFGRRAREIFSTNLFYIFGNFPIFFAMFAMSGYVSMHSSAPYHQVYAPLRGALKFEGASAVSAALGNIFGLEAQITVNTTATNIFYGLTALLLLTFGIVNVGTTYNLRSMVRGEPIFMWSDFWYAVKRNLRQGMIFGAIDLILIALLAYDVVFFYHNLGPMMMNIMFYFSLFAIVIYFLMRLYAYLLMITFDLSLFKILKNSIIFALLGFKRNIMAVLGIGLMVFLNYFLLLVYVPIGIIIPFIILFGAGAFTGAYAAYPKIKEFMIDRYQEENGEDDAETAE